MAERKTRDQKRAAHALEQLRSISSKDRSSLESLPGMIQENGILVTVVFLQAKQAAIAKAIQEWLFSDDARIPWDKAASENLAKKMQHADIRLFQVATYEALLYANWLKRWAQAYPEEFEEPSPEGSAA